MEFGDILSGKAGRPWEEQKQPPVDRLAIGRTKRRENSKTWLGDTASNRFDGESCRRS